MDLAEQAWQQVLLADPNNTEALGGVARAEKLSGHAEKSQQYVDRLRRINPNDPGIARVETMGTQRDNNNQLKGCRPARAAGTVRAVDGDLQASCMATILRRATWRCRTTRPNRRPKRAVRTRSQVCGRFRRSTLETPVIRSLWAAF